MTEKCVLCAKEIEEEYGKLKGTILKVLEENKNKFIYVCSDCQKQKDWIAECNL